MVLIISVLHMSQIITAQVAQVPTPAAEIQYRHVNLARMAIMRRIMSNIHIDDKVLREMADIVAQMELLKIRQQQLASMEAIRLMETMR